jgi:hypothetical protein
MKVSRATNPHKIEVCSKLKERERVERGNPQQVHQTSPHTKDPPIE